MTVATVRKIIVCMGIGGPYEAQLHATEPFRDHYARRHGWDTLNITTLHPRAAELRDIPFAMRTHLSKLLVPNDLRDEYDLVLFVEADTFIHPDAPCISELSRYIPAGAVGAVADHQYQERRPIFGWRGDHYDGIAKQRNIPLPPLTVRDRAVNGGVHLYRPAEVADRWLGLFEHRTGLGDEDLLNLNDVQQGSVYFLPSEWNRVWFYEKFRLGLLTRESGRVSRVHNAAINRVLWRVLPHYERSKFRKHFPVAHIHHLAFEGAKVVTMAKDLRKSYNL